MGELTVAKIIALTFWVIRNKRSGAFMQINKWSEDRSTYINTDGIEDASQYHTLNDAMDAFAHRPKRPKHPCADNYEIVRVDREVSIGKNIPATEKRVVVDAGDKRYGSAKWAMQNWTCSGSYFVEKASFGERYSDSNLNTTPLFKTIEDAVQALISSGRFGNRCMSPKFVRVAVERTPARREKDITSDTLTVVR